MERLTLDFGGTFVKYALSNQGILTEKGKAPAPLKSREQFYTCILDLVNLYRDRIDGIAISIPGVVDAAGGYVYYTGRYSHLFMQVHLGEILEEITSLRVSIENDAKCATLAELWKGALHGCQNGASLIIGSGIGCSIVLDGKLRRGANCAIGELSILSMKPGQIGMDYSLSDRCSMTGFLKRVAASKHMDENAFEIAGNASNFKKIEGKEVFEWIENGDKEAQKVYDQWLIELTWFMNMIKSLTDPEKIVIGGGVSDNPHFMQDLREYYQKYCNYMVVPGGRECVIERCAFSSDANLIGAEYVWNEKYR